LYEANALLKTEVPSEDAPEGRLLLPDLPQNWKIPLKRVAKIKWAELSSFKEYISVALLWHIAHSGILVHSYASDTNVQKCVIFSWSVILSSLLMLVLTVVLIVWRGVAGTLPTMVEQSLDIAR